MSKIALVWFRRDLRLRDNEALHAAIAEGLTPIPVYIDEGPLRYDAKSHRLNEDQGQPDSALGGASCWWLHHSLPALAGALERHGSRLLIRKGNPLDVLRELIFETGAQTVLWNRLYEPESIARDALIKSSLRSLGITVSSKGSYLLREPWELSNSSGNPFKVFTPFWRALHSTYSPPPVLSVPATIPCPEAWPNGESVDSLHLLPTIPWDKEFFDVWQPGETGAMERLELFLREGASRYEETRNLPHVDGTSMLSPHLHFGEISPHEVWRAVARLPWGDAEPFLRQLGWREFSGHMLYHFPDTRSRPLRPEFARFPWRENPRRLLRCWQKGLTGYPIVDAGMRQLWRTGWMHNRVRMIVASFLVKHLRIHWLEGASWFWDTLVDADAANNSMGWQWVAGCGADAAPYFRVFNPTMQGEKFDPQGEYVRRWVPELGSLPKKWIHSPWKASSDTLACYGIVLGKTYPRPLVDHDEARDRALAAFYSLKQGKNAD